VHVVFDHTVGVFILSGDATQFLLYMGAEVHAGTTPPHKPGLAGLVLFFDEVDSGIGGLVIDGLHALLGQRAGILDLAASRAVDHATRTELFEELRILRIILILWFLFGVQMVEIAEKFIETMIGRQHLIPITEVVFAELTCGVAMIL